MDPSKVRAALADIAAEQDPTLKSLKLASLCSTAWAERGTELVVVGGSAIEFLTEGAYASGDIDLCHTGQTTLPVRLRQEIMGQLGAKGGPRSWEIAGMFVDLLGPVESLSRSPFRRLVVPYGTVLVMKPEDLLVERVLVSVYPEPNPDARACARELAAVALKGGFGMDWDEVLRIAALPAYCNVNECKALVEEIANELRLPSPLNPD